MLDEGGCVVLASVPLGEALAKGDVVDVVERAVRAGEARVVVVGTRWYEHLASSDGVVRALPIELRSSASPRTSPR